MDNRSFRLLDVLEFKEEDENPKLIVVPYIGKFKNPNSDNNATDNCGFLECDILLGTAEQHLAMEEEYSKDAAPQSTAAHEQDSCLKMDTYEPISLVSELIKIGSSTQETSPGNDQLDCGLSVLESPSSNELVDVISHAKRGMKESSSSSPPSEIVEDAVSSNGYSSDDCFADMEMDDVGNQVVLHPDYIVYQNNYCTEPLVIFSHSGIKVIGFDKHGSHGLFNFEWGVDDVIDIECQQFQLVETVMIKLRVMANDVFPADDGCGCDTSGIEEVKVAVIESNWNAKQEKITSLNLKYMTVWKVVLDLDMGKHVDSPAQRHYFPNFDEPFEDIVYPKGDTDAVSISKRDLDLLQPDTFVNDTIIDFYIQYLKNQIEPEEKHRFHFFNSFFFRKLADLDKNPSSASDGKAAFLRVRKWTRKLNLFEKEFVFIPINFNLHWSLIVICHPGEVAGYKDDDLEKSFKVPCILHMDSIKGSHAGLKNLIQSYLWEEWKERKKETLQDISSKFFNLRFLTPELPQQENSFDCGLFLLHYLELFLAEAPANFSPFKISKFSNFLNLNWFPPTEASLKRTLIQRLIFKLIENRAQERSSAACSDERLSSNFSENNRTETGVEFLSQRCSPPMACNGNISSSQDGEGIEITLLPTSSMRSNQCIDDPSLLMRVFLEPGTSAEPSFGQYQSFAQTSSCYHINGAISQMQEDAEPEIGECLSYFPSENGGFPQTIGITSQAYDIPYSSEAFEEEISYDLGISCTQAVDLSPETSTSASDDSDEIGIFENYPHKGTTHLKEGTTQQTSLSKSLKVEHSYDLGSSTQSEYLNGDLSPGTSTSASDDLGKIGIAENYPLSGASHLEGETTQQISPSIANIELVEGSKNAKTIHDVTKNGNNDPLCEGNPIISPHPDSNALNNREVECYDVPIIGDCTVLKSHEEQHAAKRPRLTLHLEGDNIDSLTESLSLISA